MRRGVAAFVPILLAIFLLFWFIAFWGEESDNLHQANEIINLKNIQSKLVIAAIKRRYELIKEHPDLYDENDPVKKAALDKKVNEYIHELMKLNKIDN